MASRRTRGSGKARAPAKKRGEKRGEKPGNKSRARPGPKARAKRTARRHGGAGRSRRTRGGLSWQALRDTTERIVAVIAMGAFAVGVIGVVLASIEPPSDPEDICEVFRERPRWHAAAQASHARWGVSEAALLSIVFQESSFRSDARPARRLWLGFLPGFRPSSAYGFGQVLDGTWQEYLEAEARPGARRDRMHDVLDFIGWYAAVIERRAGVARDSVRELYLAYHQGPAGYARGSHRGQAWLMRAADRVETRALRYEAQYAGCRADLGRRSWLPFM